MLPWFQNGRFPLYLAPMAGFTDKAFRALCKRHGADVMVTEFVMANAVLQAGDDTPLWQIVDFTEAQRPMGVQLFGPDADLLAQAARKIADRLRPDFIDINYGCPSPRIVGQCAGSSLLRDLPQMARIAQAVVRAVPELPVTAKIRIGWDAGQVVALDAGRALVDAGVQALAIHGRTKVQGYTGDADWDVIAAVAAALPIPVIGNGAVAGGYDAPALKARGVAGLMIGRPALGYPWIFDELKARLRGETLPPPTDADRWTCLLEYARELSSQRTGSRRWDDLRWMRPRLKAFTSNIPGSRKLRLAMDQVTTLEELERLVEGRDGSRNWSQNPEASRS